MWLKSLQGIGDFDDNNDIQAAVILAPHKEDNTSCGHLVSTYNGLRETYDQLMGRYNELISTYNQIVSMHEVLSNSCYNK